MKIFKAIVFALVFMVAMLTGGIVFCFCFIILPSKIFGISELVACLADLFVLMIIVAVIKYKIYQTK